MLTRRMLLSSAVPAAAGLGLAACTSAQIQQAVQGWDNFVSQVTDLVAAGCNVTQGALNGFIPAVQSIEAVVTVLYPCAAPFLNAVAGGAAAVQAVAAALCSALPPNPPAALMAKLARAVKGVSPAVIIGPVVVYGPNGPTKVIVHGYGVHR